MFYSKWEKKIFPEEEYLFINELIFKRQLK